MEFFNDDGEKINLDLYPIPQLCLSCKKRNIEKEERFCNLIRMDQLEEEEFKCGAYQIEKKKN